MQSLIKKRCALLCAAAMTWVAATTRADQAAPAGAPAPAASSEDLVQKIKQLEQRVAELEGKGTQQVAVAKADFPQKTLDFLGLTEISGFVSASYLYNFNGSDTAGRSFDVNHDQFSFNKFKLTLEKPVNQTGDNWDAGYRADLIFGQDAKLIHSAGLFGGQDVDLEQAWVDFNVPIGNGLKVIAGKTVTLMGVEVIEEVANPNWSEGNQFLFAENFTQTGVQLAYKWNDKVDTEFVVFNGWDVVKDNNNGMSFMGRIGITPDDKTSIGIVGYFGPEQAGNSSDYRKGVNVVFNRKITDKFGLWLQGDYGREDANPALPEPKHPADWWAAGAWLTYDFCDKVGLALRGDYFDDADGARTSGVLGFPANTGQRFSSVTLTLNVKPFANLQIRPEFRWDRSSLGDAFSGHDDQITAGIGVAYLY
jgi:hypothetical protein